MNRRSIFTLSAIAALGLALLPSNIVAQQKSLKQQLIGTWTLVSMEIGGAKRANPEGTLTFDAGGRFASRFGNPDRPQSKSKGQEAVQQAVQELVAAMMDSFYAGVSTWSVNETDKTLTQRLEAGLHPIEFKSTVSLADNELKLATTLDNGDRRDMVYRRAK